MKKIKDNSLWGMIAMGMNMVILVLVIVSGVKLNAFDKENLVLQDSIRPEYEMLKDSLQKYENYIVTCDLYAKDYMRQIDEYRKDSVDSRVKLDALEMEYMPSKAKKSGKNVAVPEMSYEKKREMDSLRRKVETCYSKVKPNEDSLELIGQKCARYAQDSLSFYKLLTPKAKAFKDQNEFVDSLKDGAYSVFYVTIVLVLLKIVVFAVWLFLNTRTVSQLIKWKNSSKPFMALVSWVIPIYNLFKPCAMFSELIQETNGLLKNKSIVSNVKEDSHLETFGLWWGLSILAVIVAPVVLYLTYFGLAGFFFYLRPHFAVFAVAAIIGIVALLMECYLIFNYNKLNKKLCENESKFEE